MHTIFHYFISLFVAMVQCLVGMFEMQRNSTERWVTQMVRKSHELKGKEALGTVMARGTSNDGDSGDDTSCSAGENRYPGWPGTTVFRVLISSTKVGSIIGHKGEKVRRLCEETKACVCIIGGHLAAAERGVSCPLNGYLMSSLYFLISLRIYLS